MPRSVASSRIGVGALSSSLFHDGVTSPSGVALGSTSDFNFERNQPFSFIAYIKLIPNINQRVIVGRRQGFGDFRGWELLTETGNKLRVAIQSGASNRILITATNNNTIIIPNKWYFVAVTYDGSSTAAGTLVYLNAALLSMNVNTDNLSDTITVPGLSARIGARSNTTLLWGGNIVYVAIYSDVLSESEISQIYYNSSFPSDNQYAVYSYSDGSGSTLTDLSGNNRNGSITSCTWSSDVPHKKTGVASTRSESSQRTAIT